MVYYIGYYTCDLTRKEERIVAPAAENKMRYIQSALLDAIDENIEIVSPAETKLFQFVKGKKHKIHERVLFKTFSSFSSKNVFFRVIGHLLTKISFLLYLLIKLECEDHLLVYHSLAYMNIIKFIHKVKKCKLTIEVEELYSDVTGDEHLRKKEIDYLQIADSYLFITELLKKTVNTEKLSIISHGTYLAVRDFGQCFNDDKIHVVYAGTFRKAKGGVYTAIAVADFLNENYVLEILGNGTEEEIAVVRKLIADISGRTTCKINYAGFKTGDEFNKYIQACHIGLSTQLIDAKFNATSFPSKVLMYMSNGLKVVSVRIPAIETSKIGNQIFYYDNQDAKEIAAVIRSVSFNDDYDSRKVLDILHSEFVEDLRSILQE